MLRRRWWMAEAVRGDARMHGHTRSHEPRHTRGVAGEVAPAHPPGVGCVSLAQHVMPELPLPRVTAVLPFMALPGE